MFFIHPDHGATNASESEAATLEKQGWRRASVDEWFRLGGKAHLCAEMPDHEGEPAEGSPIPLDAQVAPMAPAKRRPGRPRKAD